MSDNHPKIPKCKWFVQTLAGTWALAYRDAEGRLEDFIPLEPINEMSFIPDESVRYFAACVAECEWRKRAERWFNLRLRAGDKLFELARKGKTSKGVQYQLENAETRESECLELAMAWRAWGMKK